MGAQAESLFNGTSGKSYCGATTISSLTGFPTSGDKRYKVIDTNGRRKCSMKVPAPRVSVRCSVSWAESTTQKLEVQAHPKRAAWGPGSPGPGFTSFCKGEVEGMTVKIRWNRGNHRHTNALFFDEWTSVRVAPLRKDRINIKRSMTTKGKHITSRRFSGFPCHTVPLVRSRLPNDRPSGQSRQPTPVVALERPPHPRAPT